MADIERLIPPPVSVSSSSSSSFTRVSLARFSQRLRHRGWTVAVTDKENVPPPPPVVDKRVKFDKRVYHGPVRCRPVRDVRGILKTSSGARAAAIGGNARSDAAVPNRMRAYDEPVTSFYIGTGEHLQMPPPTAVKRSSTMATATAAAAVTTTATGAARTAKKTKRRFGTEIGSSR